MSPKNNKTTKQHLMNEFILNSRDRTKHNETWFDHIIVAEKNQTTLYNIQKYRLRKARVSEFSYLYTNAHIVFRSCLYSIKVFNFFSILTLLDLEQTFKVSNDGDGQEFIFNEMSLLTAGVSNSYKLIKRHPKKR